MSLNINGPRLAVIVMYPVCENIMYIAPLNFV